jgi:hypothetical protein
MLLPALGMLAVGVGVVWAVPALADMMRDQN